MIIINKNFLEQEYVVKGKTFREISNELGCSKDTVQYYAKKFGITIRKKGRRRAEIKIGQQYGSLTILFPSLKKSKHPKYICKCKCGEILESTASELFQGKRMCWECRNNFISESKWKGFGEISGEFWEKVKNSAKVRGYKFDITIKQGWDLFLQQERRCALSGVSLQFIRGRHGKRGVDSTTASLDRINSSLPYTLDNIQWVHKDINKMKWELSQERFIELCKKVAEWR